MTSSISTGAVKYCGNTLDKQLRAAFLRFCCLMLFLSCIYLIFILDYTDYRAMKFRVLINITKNRRHLHNLPRLVI